MKLREHYPYYLANKPVFDTSNLLGVIDKFSGKEVCKVSMASREIIDQAIAKAVSATQAMRKLASYQRQNILYHCVERFQERFDELAMSLCIEAGKPIKDAEGEAGRLIDTFRIAAEEAVRMYGEIIPMDITARATGYTGYSKRVPIGPCSFISPFNFPLNLAAHKIAPAIAAGCPFILKPASLTPIGALIIGEVLAETDLPEGVFSILPCSRDGADLFTTDDRLKLLSFTGSPQVGWNLKAKAGKRPVVLELGGNAACIVDEDADLDDAVTRIVFGAYYQSGQSCVSVQRILAHHSIYNQFKSKLMIAVSRLKSGDPKDRETFIGPIISQTEADRIKQWIDEAVKTGANLLCGGTQKETIIEATLLENVPGNQKLNCQEVFGPVAILSSFTDFDQALNEVNDSDFGLQAGIFTQNLYKAQKAWDELEVGGVIIGDVPSWRVDHMPYGGVKDSGLGREGIRYAIEDMTEIRLMVVRTPPNG